MPLPEPYQNRIFTPEEVERSIEYLKTTNRELWVTLLDRDVMNQSIGDIASDLWFAIKKAPAIKLPREVGDLVGAVRSRNFKLYVQGKGIENFQFLSTNSEEQGHTGQ